MRLDVAVDPYGLAKGIKGTQQGGKEEEQNWEMEHNFLTPNYYFIFFNK